MERHSDSFHLFIMIWFDHKTITHINVSGRQEDRNVQVLDNSPQDLDQIPIMTNTMHAYHSRGHVWTCLSFILSRMLTSSKGIHDLVFKTKLQYFQKIFIACPDRGGGYWPREKLQLKSLPRSPPPPFGNLNYPLDPRPHPRKIFPHVKINLDSTGVSLILYYITVFIRRKA